MNARYAVLVVALLVSLAAPVPADAFSLKTPFKKVGQGLVWVVGRTLGFVLCATGGGGCR